MAAAARRGPAPLLRAALRLLVITAACGCAGGVLGYHLADLLIFLFSQPIR